MLIADSKKLKDTFYFRLTVNDCVLERETTFKYLGIVFNENLPWADHIEFVRRKLIKDQARIQDFEMGGEFL